MSVVPPRPRDPDAFLGRSSNVGATGVLPAVERSRGQGSGTTTTLKAPTNSIYRGTVTATGSPTAPAADVTLPSNGLWVIDPSASAVWPLPIDVHQTLTMNGTEIVGRTDITSYPGDTSRVPIPRTLLTIEVSSAPTTVTFEFASPGGTDWSDPTLTISAYRLPGDLAP